MTLGGNCLFCLDLLKKIKVQRQRRNGEIQSLHTEASKQTQATERCLNIYEGTCLLENQLLCVCIYQLPETTLYQNRSKSYKDENMNCKLHVKWTLRWGKSSTNMNITRKLWANATNLGEAFAIL